MENGEIRQQDEKDTINQADADRYLRMMRSLFPGPILYSDNRTEIPITSFETLPNPSIVKNEINSQIPRNTYDQDRYQRLYDIGQDAKRLKEFLLTMDTAIDTLTPQEQEFLLAEYNGTNWDRTREELAKKYGISRERVRQIAENASRKMAHNKTVRALIGDEDSDIDDDDTLAMMPDDEEDLHTPLIPHDPNDFEEPI